MRLVLAASLAVVLSGCGTASGLADRDQLAPAAKPGVNGGSASAGNPGTGKPGTGKPSTNESGTNESGAGAPAPDAAIPANPAKLAAGLEATTTALYRGIDAWTRSKAAQPPQDVVLYALHHQRIYRTLARNAKLSAAVIAKLPKPIAAEARDNAKAVGKLLSMARPISDARRKKMRLAEAEPAATLRGHMVKAEKRFGVEWEVLAAIMLVETKFGRVRSASSTGAQGPMQFMPGTWKAYGMGGDVQNAKDAIMAAANYLKATGAPRNYRRAVFAYNHDVRYVDAVLVHAAQIKRDPRSYYAYYNWQVFVLSAKGDVRLTGPR
ncbi:lytic murein transglycosylase [Nonomuraea typhae]|uniref:lytic transglycosylase domain-containing protein n=1 Tax=Nonomuraea typhae TaxID=2603600 RepID=UPI0012F7DD01|nr:lytic murein transglycosylase [Nonomuraea typhae]